MSHIERVETERNELSDKVNALQTFIHASDSAFTTLDKDEQDRLIQQLVMMRRYLAILNERLQAAHTK